MDAIVTPETGKLNFYVVELTDDAGLVLVPLGQTNIPQAALEPEGTFELVLLAENQQLRGAPRVDSVEQALASEAQGAARQYWGQ